MKYEIDLVELKCSNDDEENKIVCIQYLTEMSSIFLSNTKGDLMTMSLTDGEVFISFLFQHWYLKLKIKFL